VEDVLIDEKLPDEEFCDDEIWIEEEDESRLEDCIEEEGEESELKLLEIDELVF
jgi:hypothetical protein